MSKSHEKAAEAFAKELRKTKGGVTVTEDESGEFVVRTRDGDTHRFPEGWKALEEAND